MSEAFSPEVQKVLEQVQKLLNLAAKNPNEHEAALAASKAQELLTRYNLSAEAVDAAAGADGKRSQEAVDGGFYRFHRELWEEVARLNFCLHWTQRALVHIEKKQHRNWDGTTFKAPGKVLRNRNVLVGRIVNVKTTIAMTRYLMAAIERLAAERCEEGRHKLWGNWAMSYREGMSYRLQESLRDRRQTLLDEEERTRREAEDRASRTGVSLETALTIGSHTRKEAEANLDFIHGEGYSAKQAARRARRAEQQRREEEEYTRWAAANPKEAARKAAEEKAEEDKRSKRRDRGARDSRYDNVDNQAFWAGHKAAEEIGLDPQAEGTKIHGRLK